MRLSTDLVDMKREIERFEGVDGFEGFLGFMQESHRHYEHSVDHVLHRNFYSLFSMLRPSFLPYVQQLHPFEALVRFSSFTCRGGSGFTPAVQASLNLLQDGPNATSFHLCGDVHG
jgi:phytoene desaturase (3,4-didehydrolycopene-forming)